MPLIADPGFELSRAAVAQDVMQTCAPGPSAVLTALVFGGAANGCLPLCRILAQCDKCATQSIGRVGRNPRDLGILRITKTNWCNT